MEMPLNVTKDTDDERHIEIELIDDVRQTAWSNFRSLRRLRKFWSGRFEYCCSEGNTTESGGLHIRGAPFSPAFRTAVLDQDRNVTRLTNLEL